MRSDDVGTTVPARGAASGHRDRGGGRAPEIDAVRGWAALSVVCFHVFWETFGVVVPWLRNPYTAGLLAGHFDVILFFILSGDALSFPFFHGGGTRYLQRAALKRYPRLTLPIVVVTAAVALAMAFGLPSTEAAGEIVGRPDWLGQFARFAPAGNSALSFAFVQVYGDGGRANYLPFLWTMPVELLGSFVLLLTLFVVPCLRFGSLVVAGVAFVLVSQGSYVGCFLVGSLLGQARAAGLYGRLPGVVTRVVAPLGIVLALVVVGRRQSTGDQTLRGLVELGAILLVCVYSSEAVVGFLAKNRLSQLLGRISYLLYLWHYVVLVTLTSRAVVLAADADGTLSVPAALGIGLATVAVSVAVACWTLPIEGWARRANAFTLLLLWRDAPAETAPTAQR